MTGRFIDNYLPYLLARAGALVSRDFHDRLKRHRVPVLMWRTLSILSDGEGISVGKLAKLTLSKQPTITKLVDRMSEQELVERRAAARDRRRAMVFLTPKGRDLVADLLVAASQLEREMLADFSDDEIGELKASLRTLIASDSAPRQGSPTIP